MEFIEINNRTLDIQKPYDITGIDYKFGFTDNGSLVISENQQKIRNNIIVILLTLRGEALMEPSFGSLLLRAIYAPIDSFFEQKVKQECFDSIARFEQGAIVNNVILTRNNEDNRFIDLTIDFTIKYLNTPDKLVLTFDRSNQGDF